MDAHWAPAALTAAIKYVTGLSATPAPSSLYAALSETSADPAGPGFTELTVANYTRQLVGLSYLSDYVVTTTADVNFADLGAGSYQGVGLFDPSGPLMFWADLDEPVDIADGQTVTLKAGLINVVLLG